MTLKKFLLRNPALLNALKSCNTLQEFEAIAEISGVKFGEGSIEKAYYFVKSISFDDELNDKKSLQTAKYQSSDEEMEIVGGGNLWVKLSPGYNIVGRPNVTVLTKISANNVLS